MASASEAELGGVFENCQNVTSMLTALAEMGHSQTPTLVITDNTASNIIVNGTAKHKISRLIYMMFYWVRDRIRQNRVHIFWEEGNKNLADYVTKHHPICHHRTMRPIYLKPRKNILKTQKTGKQESEEGVLELPILG